MADVKIPYYSVRRKRRHAEFGPTENRTLADFRRSGAQEAFAGDAKPADVSHAMADTIATYFSYRSGSGGSLAF